MCPVLTTQCFSGCLLSEATGVSLYFEDDLTSGIQPSRHQALEMESLPSIVFGPHAVAAARGVRRKSDQSGGRK